MQHFFDAASAWLAGWGVDPVLAAFVAGILVTLVVLRGRRASTDASFSLSLGSRPSSDAAGRMFERSTTVIDGSTASITINDQTVSLPPDKLAELTRLVRDKSKIEAIKLLREATGLQLVDAKRVVETMERSSLLQ